MENSVNVISLTSSEDESTSHVTRNSASFTKEFKTKFDAIFSNREYMTQNFPHLLFAELLNDIKQFMSNPKYSIVSKSSFWRNFLDKIYKPSLITQFKIHKDIKYNRTLGAIMAEYLNFQCEILKLEIEKYPDAETARELQGKIKYLCQILGASLLHIFNGNKDFVTFALLQVKPDKHYQTLLSKLFSNILSYYNKVTMEDHITYVRLILCFRRWKTLVSHATVKKAINEISRRVLPQNMSGRGSLATRDFLQILPKHRKDKENATNFLINHKLLEGGLLDKAINRYFDAHEEYAANSKTIQKRQRFVKSSTLTEQNLNIFNNPTSTASAVAVRGDNSTTIDLSSDDSVTDDVVCITPSPVSNNNPNINSKLALSRLGSTNSNDTRDIVPFKKCTTISKCDNSIIVDKVRNSKANRLSQNVMVESDADSESDQDRLYIKNNKLRRKKKKRKVLGKFRQNVSQYESTDSNASVQVHDDGGTCLRNKLKSQTSRNSSQVSSTTNIDSIVPINQDCMPEKCQSSVTIHTKVSRESTQSPHISTSNFTENPLSPVSLPSSSGIVEIGDTIDKSTNKNPLYSDISDTEIDLNCSPLNDHEKSSSKDKGGSSNNIVLVKCESTTLQSPDSGVSASNNSKENSDNEVLSVCQVSPPPSDGDFISKSDPPCASSSSPNNVESLNSEVILPSKKDIKSKLSNEKKCLIISSEEIETVPEVQYATFENHFVHEIELESTNDQNESNDNLDEGRNVAEITQDDIIVSQTSCEKELKDVSGGKLNDSVLVHEEVQLSTELVREEIIEHNLTDNEIRSDNKNGLDCVKIVKSTQDESNEHLEEKQTVTEVTQSIIVSETNCDIELEDVSDCKSNDSVLVYEEVELSTTEIIEHNLTDNETLSEDQKELDCGKTVKSTQDETIVDGNADKSNENLEENQNATGVPQENIIVSETNCDRELEDVSDCKANDPSIQVYGEVELSTTEIIEPNLTDSETVSDEKRITVSTVNENETGGPQENIIASATNCDKESEDVSDCKSNDSIQVYEEVELSTIEFDGEEIIEHNLTDTETVSDNQKRLERAKTVKSTQDETIVDGNSDKGNVNLEKNQNVTGIPQEDIIVSELNCDRESEDLSDCKSNDDIQVYEEELSTIELVREEIIEHNLTDNQIILDNKIELDCGKSIQDEIIVDGNADKDNENLEENQNETEVLQETIVSETNCDRESEDVSDCKSNDSIQVFEEVELSTIEIIEQSSNDSETVSDNKKDLDCVNSVKSTQDEPIVDRNADKGNEHLEDNQNESELSQKNIIASETNYDRELEDVSDCKSNDSIQVYEEIELSTTDFVCEEIIEHNLIDNETISDPKKGLDCVKSGKSTQDETIVDGNADEVHDNIICENLFVTNDIVYSVESQEIGKIGDQCDKTEAIERPKNNCDSSPLHIAGNEKIIEQKEVKILEDLNREPNTVEIEESAQNAALEDTLEQSVSESNPKHCKQREIKVKKQKLKDFVLHDTETIASAIKRITNVTSKKHKNKPNLEERKHQSKINFKSKKSVTSKIPVKLSKIEVNADQQQNKSKSNKDKPIDLGNHTLCNEHESDHKIIHKSSDTVVEKKTHSKGTAHKGKSFNKTKKTKDKTDVVGRKFSKPLNNPNISKEEIVASANMLEERKDLNKHVVGSGKNDQKINDKLQERLKKVSSRNCTKRKHKNKSLKKKTSTTSVIAIIPEKVENEFKAINADHPKNKPVVQISQNKEKLEETTSVSEIQGKYKLNEDRPIGLVSSLGIQNENLNKQDHKSISESTGTADEKENKLSESLNKNDEIESLKMAKSYINLSLDLSISQLETSTSKTVENESVRRQELSNISQSIQCSFVSSDEALSNSLNQSSSLELEKPVSKFQNIAENVKSLEINESKECVTTAHCQDLDSSSHVPDQIIKCLSKPGQLFQRQDIVIETDKSNHVEFNKSPVVDQDNANETLKPNLLEQLSNYTYTYCQPEFSSASRKPLTLVLDKKFENISDDEVTTKSSVTKDTEVMQILANSPSENGTPKSDFMIYLNLTPNSERTVENNKTLILSPTPSNSKGRRTKPKCVRKLDTTKPINTLINLELLAMAAEELSDKPEITKTPKLSKRKHSELKRSIKTKLKDSRRFRDRMNRVATRCTRSTKQLESKPLESLPLVPKSILKPGNVVTPVKTNMYEDIWQQDRTSEILKASLDLIKIDVSKTVPSKIPSSTNVSSDSDSDRLVIADYKVKFDNKVKTITTKGEFLTDLNDINDGSNNESDASPLTNINRNKKLTKTRDGNNCRNSESDEDVPTIKSHKEIKSKSNSDDISNWIYEIDLLSKFETNFPPNDAFNTYQLPLIVEDIPISATLNSSSLLTLFKLRFIAIHRCIKLFDIKNVLSPHTLKGVLEKVEMIQSKIYMQNDLSILETHLKDLDHHLRKLKKIERGNEKISMLYDFLKSWDKRIKLRRKRLKTKWNNTEKVNQWHRLIKNGTEMTKNVLNLGVNVLKQKIDETVDDFAQLEQCYKSPHKIFEDTLKNFVIPDTETIGSTYGDSIASSTIKHKTKSNLENRNDKNKLKTRKVMTSPGKSREVNLKYQKLHYGKSKKRLDVPSERNIEEQLVVAERVKKIKGTGQLVDDNETAPKSIVKCTSTQVKKDKCVDKINQINDNSNNVVRDVGKPFKKTSDTVTIRSAKQVEKVNSNDEVEQKPDHCDNKIDEPLDETTKNLLASQAGNEQNTNELVEEIDKSVEIDIVADAPEKINLNDRAVVTKDGEPINESTNKANNVVLGTKSVEETINSNDEKNINNEGEQTNVDDVSEQLQKVNDVQTVMDVAVTQIEEKVNSKDENTEIVESLVNTANDIEMHVSNRQNKVNINSNDKIEEPVNEIANQIDDQIEKVNNVVMEPVLNKVDEKVNSKAVDKSNVTKGNIKQKEERVDSTDEIIELLIANEKPIDDLMKEIDECLEETSDPNDPPKYSRSKTKNSVDVIDNLTEKIDGKVGKNDDQIRKEVDETVASINKTVHEKAENEVLVDKCVLKAVSENVTKCRIDNQIVETAVKTDPKIIDEHVKNIDVTIPKVKESSQSKKGKIENVEKSNSIPLTDTLDKIINEPVDAGRIKIEPIVTANEAERMSDPVDKLEEPNKHIHSTENQLDQQIDERDPNKHEIAKESVQKPDQSKCLQSGSKVTSDLKIENERSPVELRENINQKNKSCELDKQVDTESKQCILQVQVKSFNDHENNLKIEPVNKEGTHVESSENKAIENTLPTIDDRAVGAVQNSKTINQSKKMTESNELEADGVKIELVKTPERQIQDDVNTQNSGNNNDATVYHSESESSVDYVEEFTKIEKKTETIPTTSSKQSEENDELIEREDKRKKVVQEIQSEIEKIISNTSEEHRRRAEKENNILKRRTSISPEPDYKIKVSKIETTSPKVPDLSTQSIVSENSDNSCHSNKSGIDFPECLLPSSSSATSQPSFSIPLITSSPPLPIDTETKSFESKIDDIDNVDIVESLISKNLSSNNQIDSDLDLDELRDFFYVFDNFDHNVLDRSNTSLNWENEFPNSLNLQLDESLDNDSSNDKNATLKKEKDCMISGNDDIRSGEVPWECILYPLSYSIDSGAQTCVNMDCILENKNKMLPVVASTETEVENIGQNTTEPSSYMMVDIFANKSFDEVIYNEDQSNSTLVDQTIKELSNQLPKEEDTVKTTTTVNEEAEATTPLQNDLDLVVFDPHGDTESNVESPNPSYPKNYQQTELITINHDDIKENDSKSENFELINVFLNRRKITNDSSYDTIELLSDSADSSRSSQPSNSEGLTSPTQEDSTSINDENSSLPTDISQQAIPELEQKSSPIPEETHSSLPNLESPLHEDISQEETETMQVEKLPTEQEDPPKKEDDKLDENVIIVKKKSSPIAKPKSPEKSKLENIDFPIQRKSTPLPLSKHTPPSKLKRTPSYTELTTPPSTSTNTSNSQLNSKQVLKTNFSASPNVSGKQKPLSYKNGPLDMPNLDFDEDSNCITQFIIHKSFQAQPIPTPPPLPPPLVKIQPPPPPGVSQTGSLNTSKQYTIKVRPVIETKDEMNSFLNSSVSRELKRPSVDVQDSQCISKKPKLDKFDLLKNTSVDKLALPHSSSASIGNKLHSTTPHSSLSVEKRSSVSSPHIKSTAINGNNSRSLSPVTGTNSNNCSNNLSNKHPGSYSSSSKDRVYRSSSVNSQNSSRISKPYGSIKPVSSKYVPILTQTIPPPPLRTYSSKSRLIDAETNNVEPKYKVMTLKSGEISSSAPSITSYSAPSSTSSSSSSSSMPPSSKPRLSNSDQNHQSRSMLRQQYRSKPKNKYAFELYSLVGTNKNASDVLTVTPSWEPKQCSTDELLEELKKAWHK